MNFLDRLNHDLKEAMRSKDKVRLSVIRMVKGAMQNEAIQFKKDMLTEDEALTVLLREVKQRKDSLQEFEKANRQDLAAKLQEELQILDEYMPEQLSEDELRKIVSQAIEETGATSKKEIGKVMSYVLPKVKGKADGGIVNKIVQQLLL
ncbi:MAG: GatB/YqeY domain-containing protein [Bacillales bacterium]|mgnify:FL=1|nr:GatB/YqeY domain-containing protein [Bacillales bacterium]